MPNREEAFRLLMDYNKNSGLITHALCVESVMRYAAEIRNEDPDKWGIIGLVHDIDYEKYPDEHCRKAREILEQYNWPEDYIHAVCSHGWQICNNVEPVHWMEKFLYAADELTGLIYATCLMRPSKSILDLSVKSVKKKWKTKSFAAGVDRDLILKGAAMIGMELDELIGICIDAMKGSSDVLGLTGNVSIQ